MNKKEGFTSVLLMLLVVVAVAAGYLIFSSAPLTKINKAKADPEGENAYCAPGNVPSFGSSDGPAVLPQSCFYTAMSATQASGVIINVTSTGGVAAALASAHCGDTVQLLAGATFVPFSVPAKGCDANHYITIRTSAPDAVLPLPGVRITPCYAGVASLPGRPAYSCANLQNSMAQIVAQSKVVPAISFATGAGNYRFIGLNVTRAANIGTVSGLIKTNGADHIIFDRMWIHGTATDTTTVGVNLDTSNFIAIVDSYMNDFHCVSTSCSDAKAITGGSSNTTDEGAWKFVNNFIEGSAENIGFGIANSSSTVAPSDIEIRHNHFFKPTMWMPGDPNYNGLSFLVRDHLEFKNGARVLIEGNVFQNSWAGFGLQQGAAIIITPRVTATAGPAGSCANCYVSNITMRYNTASHFPQAIAIVPPGNATEKYASGFNGFSFHDDVFDDLNYLGCNRCNSVYTNQMYDGIDNNLPPSSDVLHNVTINHVTQVSSGNPIGLLVLGGMTAANPPQQSNITITNSIFQGGTKGLANSASSSGNCAVVGAGSPQRMFDTCWNSYTFSNNVIVGGNRILSGAWPLPTFSPPNSAAIGFVNLHGGIGGDYHLAPTSSYKNAGTDGLDIGANIDLVSTYTNGATSGVWSN